MVARKRSTKAASRQAVAVSATSTPVVVKFSDLPPGHPTLVKFLRDADAARAEYFEAEKRARARKRDDAKKKVLKLPEGRARELEHEIWDLGNMFSAVERLTTQLVDSDASDAAMVALEAIGELGAYKASLVASALGGGWTSAAWFEDRLEKYARANGYVRPEEAQR